MFSRSNMDFCMGEVTSKGVNSKVWKVQDRGLICQKCVQ